MLQITLIHNLQPLLKSPMPIFKKIKSHFGINQLFKGNLFCLPYEFTMSENEFPNDR